MNVKESTPNADLYVWTEQNCPICGSAPDKFVGTRGGESHREGIGVECEVWRCSNCYLIFPNPMPFPKDGLGQHYDVDADEYFKEHDATGRFDGAKQLLEKAEKILGHKGRLLDIGVGRGELLLAAKELEWDAEGVEPSTTFADHAEKRTGLKIWREAIEDSSVPDSSYDAIILAAVLEHLYDPDEIIRRVAQALKPGGILFLDVPNEAGLYFRIGNVYQKFRGRNWCVNLAPTFSPYHVFGLCFKWRTCQFTIVRF
ncbi:class I SAM-dependent methyltransferase [Leptolyngbya sp. 7M]|uniref:class I SAM-dependent methyltransferase n=1 Tax=Leptolyngbya sp. 7M TaxID=2812896 RepID=UPI001B8C8459|nr:class I SAM-dependent methyltransferase [Leptolyngbya sp. 7M]QYO63781.1 class I SAM-dependent methyltransferase [Leptolyngbya sp. 7M]